MQGTGAPCDASPTFVKLDIHQPRYYCPYNITVPATLGEGDGLPFQHRPAARFLE